MSPMIPLCDSYDSNDPRVELLWAPWLLRGAPMIPMILLWNPYELYDSSVGFRWFLWLPCFDDSAIDPSVTVMLDLGNCFNDWEVVRRGVWRSAVVGWVEILRINFENTTFWGVPPDKILAFFLNFPSWLITRSQTLSLSLITGRSTALISTSTFARVEPPLHDYH